MSLSNLRNADHRLRPKPKRAISHSKSLVTRVYKRDISPKQVLILYVQAGGRCEFLGCNHYLLKHSVTQTIDNFGEIAHIVAFSPRGPRGKVRTRPKNIHALENLTLLCDECHKLIDGHPGEYSVAQLREYKQQHEQDIYEATSIPRSEKTAIVRLEAPINGSQVSIPMTQVQKAISPKHPLEMPSCYIDLNQTALIGTKPIFIESASRIIEEEIQRFLTPGLRRQRVEHVSIFALAPIPLLVCLGYQIGNTIPADIYHHHHDRDDWTWKSNRHSLTFEHTLLRPGTQIKRVALIISVSGTVDIGSLPDEIDQSFYIYRISPCEEKPSKNCMRTREDLDNFKRAYEDFRRDLRRRHIRLKTIHLFPAVPPPIAIVCGRELMPKVDPALRVYDYDKNQDGFKFSLEVNANDNR